MDRKSIRGYVQAGWTVISNSYIVGFVRGTIYQGKTKMICVPGLNCYSCPGARGACPIGSLQACIGGRTGRFPFYVLGMLLAFGILLGRFICGWLCPFGWIQDIVFKLPPKKKIRSLRGEKYLRKMPYVTLLIFVVGLPALAYGDYGVGIPWFCKYICPSGTLGGAIPLLLANELLRSQAGALFLWKALILFAVLFLSIKLYRPFCRYICPLGAIYGLINPISLLSIKVEKEKCVDCGICQRSCELSIPVNNTPNSTACIRCGKCIRVCPHGALRMSWK